MQTWGSLHGAGAGNWGPLTGDPPWANQGARTRPSRRSQTFMCLGWNLLSAISTPAAARCQGPNSGLWGWLVEFLTSSKTNFSWKHSALPSAVEFLQRGLVWRFYFMKMGDCISLEQCFKTGASFDSPRRQFGSFQDAYLSMRVWKLKVGKLRSLVEEFYYRHF